MPEGLERSFVFAECRAHEDRLELAGTVVRFGDVADVNVGGRMVSERFEAGAFGNDLTSSDVVLNWQHDRTRPLARTGGGGLELSLTSEALTMVARLNEDLSYARDLIHLVRSKVIRSLSVEFVPLKVRWEGMVRVIEKAKLLGVGVVTKGAYPESLVAAREAELAAREHELANEKMPYSWWAF